MKITALTGKAIPERLRRISTPPKTLYYTGNLGVIKTRPCVSVVGSRKPSAYGRQVTEQLVTELAACGVVIISGLAFGVDSIAHRACLSAGGLTIAVLPSSLQAIYPAVHCSLAVEIVEQGGALVSEYADGATSYKGNFIARNRLISGLADALLIVEAAEGSGTQHTASYAAEQNKTVMAVPGNITSPLSSVTNRLIKNCAIPVTETADILQQLGLGGVQYKKEIVAATAEEATLIDLMRLGISDAAQLLQDSTLEPALFNQTLTMLEISGKIRPLGANHWALN